jgi:hypothetical protein
MKIISGIFTKNKNTGGHTIIEVMIVTVLLVVAGALTAALCSFGLQSFRLINARIDNQQKAAKIMNRINREISNTRFSSITFVYPPQSPTKENLAISFMTPVDKTGKFITDIDDLPIYQAHIIFFLDKDTGTLKTRRIELEKPTTEASALSAEDLALHISGTGTVVATNVEEFKAQSFKTDEILTKPKNPFKLMIKLEDNNEERLEKSSLYTKSFRFNQ